MRIFITIFFGFFLPSTAMSAWMIDERVDAMTDQVRKTAYVQNNLGHRFSIYRLSEGGIVMGNFSLSDDVFDQIDPQRALMYRIDKNKPFDTSGAMKMPEIMKYEWQPKWVNFQMWHGKESEGLSPTIIQLMEGETLLFRYHLSTGGYKDTSFTLKGAANAIAGAIGISAEIDHEAERKNQELKKAYTDEITVCQKNMSTFQKCFSRISNCYDKANNDIEAFKSCLK